MERPCIFSRQGSRSFESLLGTAVWITPKKPRRSRRQVSVILGDAQEARLSIVYDPKKLLAKIAPPQKIKKLLRGDVTVKKTALNFVDATEFIDKKAVSRVALETARSYQLRIAKAQAEAGLDAEAGAAIEAEILANPAQLIQRVQNEFVFQISNEIKDQYAGEQYEWLPSDAEEPDPEHQLNYGKVFTIGDGEQPGERYGCRCGMNILVKETELQLE